MIAGGRSKRVMPGLIAVDLAQAVARAVFGEPCSGLGMPDVHGVTGDVRGRVWCRDPARGFRFRPVLGDRLLKKSLLVLRRPPAAVEVESDPGSRRIGGGF